MKRPPEASVKIKSRMQASPIPSSRTHPPAPRTPQHHLKMNRLPLPNPETLGKKDLGEVGETEGPKMQMSNLDFQGPLPGGKWIAPLRGDAALYITMGCPPKGAEPVEDGGENSLGVDVATVEPTHLPLGPVEGVVEEWGAGVAETFVHLLLGATKMSPGERGPLAGMDKIAHNTTQPGPETEARPVVRVLSTRKSPRGEGSEALRPAVTAVPVSTDTPTRTRSRKPTPKMAPTMPSPLEACHLPPREVPRPGSSRPEGYLLEEEGVGATGEATSTVAAAMSEEHLGRSEWVLLQPRTVGPPGHRPPGESSKAPLSIQGPKTRAKGPLGERRKTNWASSVKARAQPPSLPSPLCLLLQLPPQALLKMEPLQHSRAVPAIMPPPLGGPPCCRCPPPGALSDHPAVGVTAAPSISKTSRPAFAGSRRGRMQPALMEAWGSLGGGGPPPPRSTRFRRATERPPLP